MSLVPRRGAVAGLLVLIAAAAQPPSVTVLGIVALVPAFGSRSPVHLQTLGQARCPLFVVSAADCEPSSVVSGSRSLVMSASSHPEPPGHHPQSSTPESHRRPVDSLASSPIRIPPPVHAHTNTTIHITDPEGLIFATPASRPHSLPSSLDPPSSLPAAFLLQDRPADGHDQRGWPGRFDHRPLPSDEYSDMTDSEFDEDPNYAIKNSLNRLRFLNDRSSESQVPTTSADEDFDVISAVSSPAKSARLDHDSDTSPAKESPSTGPPIGPSASSQDIAPSSHSPDKKGFFAKVKYKTKKLLDKTAEKHAKKSHSRHSPTQSEGILPEARQASQPACAPRDAASRGEADPTKPLSAPPSSTVLDTASGLGPGPRPESGLESGPESGPGSTPDQDRQRHAGTAKPAALAAAAVSGAQAPGSALLPQPSKSTLNSWTTAIASKTSAEVSSVFSSTSSSTAVSHGLAATFVKGGDKKFSYPANRPLPNLLGKEVGGGLVLVQEIRCIAKEASAELLPGVAPVESKTTKEPATESVQQAGASGWSGILSHSHPGSDGAASSTTPGHEISVMRFSDNGLLLAAAGKLGIIWIWEVCGRDQSASPVPHPASRPETKARPNRPVFARSHSDVAPRGLQMVEHDGPAVAGKAAAGAGAGASADVPPPVFKPTPVRIFAGHGSDILDLAWSRNNFLISASSDGQVRLWHPQEPSPLCIFEHPDAVSAVRFHPIDDRYFVSSCADRKIRVWSLVEKKVKFWNEMIFLDSSVTALCFNLAGDLVICGSDQGDLVFFEFNGLKYHTQIEVKALSRSRSVRGGKRIIGIERIPNRTLEQKIMAKYQGTKLVAALNQEPDPQIVLEDEKILVTSSDSRVRIYNLRDKSLFQKFKGSEHRSASSRASCSWNGRYIVSGSDEKAIYIWNTCLDENSALQTVHLHSPLHSTTASSSSGSALFGGLMGWHLDNQTKYILKLSGLEEPVLCTAFAPSGTRVYLEQSRLRRGLLPAEADAPMDQVYSQILVSVDASGLMRVYESENSLGPMFSPTASVSMGKSSGTSTGSSILRGLARTPTIPTKSTGISSDLAGDLHIHSAAQPDRYPGPSPSNAPNKAQSVLLTLPTSSTGLAKSSSVHMVQNPTDVSFLPRTLTSAQSISSISSGDLVSRPPLSGMGSTTATLSRDSGLRPRTSLGSGRQSTTGPSGRASLSSQIPEPPPSSLQEGAASGRGSPTHLAQRERRVSAGASTSAALALAHGATSVTSLASATRDASTTSRAGSLTTAAESATSTARRLAAPSDSDGLHHARSGTDAFPDRTAPRSIQRGPSEIEIPTHQRSSSGFEPIVTRQRSHSHSIVMSIKSLTERLASPRSSQTQREIPVAIKEGSSGSVSSSAEQRAESVPIDASAPSALLATLGAHPTNDGRPKAKSLQAESSPALSSGPTEAEADDEGGLVCSSCGGDSFTVLKSGRMKCLRCGYLTSLPK
ncbi:uncharacterized protein BJ171DRAFT_473902 [Polychytrium aggregatum]|uniref:uncharacterized protein n=1 Tax=Polychytrium aggregatum TaxID=110093 RepID=UPI0022FE6738|nr:uncharacterized protein BJ171DRAFT_473902 [Polychytrium aggregatum]KAI9205887.1 hypothetical protein BJ171DRAFT_473902 [Polychytrium aggregatum]